GPPSSRHLLSPPRPVPAGGGIFGGRSCRRASIGRTSVRIPPHLQQVNQPEQDLVHRGCDPRPLPPADHFAVDPVDFRRPPPFHVLQHGRPVGSGFSADFHRPPEQGFRLQLHPFGAG